MNRVMLFLGSLLFFTFSCQKDNESVDAAPVIPADCLVKASANSGAIIVGSYIVLMKPNGLRSTKLSEAALENRAEDLMSAYTSQPEQVVEHTFQGQSIQGFVAEMDANTARRLQNDPAIELVEPDRILGLCACVEVFNSRQVVWNVRKTGYGNGLNFNRKTVWIIDSGVDYDHPDLSVDKERSRSFVSDEATADDVNGHGTHVAGIIGALNNNLGVIGVASGAKIVALKVLNKEGEGRTSDIIRAVAHVGLNGQPGDVVNMSLGGEGSSFSLEREIKAAADRGILFAIAAGNEGEDAAKYAPANVNHINVFTVSAVDSTDTFAKFSNYNSQIVDVAAYGVRITSTWLGGRYATASGTSAAAPHVAALLLIRGTRFPVRGTALQDPDGMPDPIARQ